ncbi:MAG: MobA/MobL family protein [Proteobacteria bacterium]|nr:MobA/MobL family protein [Pseudomonadota bacterium]
MAIYHFSVKPVTRAAGRSATASAAYRAAARIADRNSGEVFDYTRKRGVDHREIVLPTAAAKRDINWARNREELWNVAEASERRRNSRVAREYEVALPHELSRAQRLELARGFAHDLADRYGVAVDIAIHRPHRAGDARNHHAHLLTTTRVIEPAGLGDKSAIEWSDTNRRRVGLKPAREEITVLRDRWAEATNRALAHAQRRERVDHRSLEAQEIDREPTRHLGPAVSALLNRGHSSWLALRWQEEARERLQLARQAGELEREHAQVSRSILDLSNDIVASLKARERQRERDLTRVAQKDREQRRDFLAEAKQQGRDALAELRRQVAEEKQHLQDLTREREQELEREREAEKQRKRDRSRDLEQDGPEFDPLKR